MKKDANGKVIRDSEFYAEIARKVKKRYKPTSEKAREMQKKSVEKHLEKQTSSIKAKS